MKSNVLMGRLGIGLGREEACLWLDGMIGVGRRSQVDEAAVGIAEG